LEKRAYFHARVLNSFYQFVLEKFLKEESAGRLTKAELARRIGRRPEVVSRLLGAPGNWRLETATDLLLGIAGEELKPGSSPLLGRPPRNYAHPEWLRMPPGTRSASANMSFKFETSGPQNLKRDATSTHSKRIEVDVNAPI